LVEDQNVFGLFLLLAGVALTLSIVGGPLPWHGTREWQRAEVEEEVEERRRRTGEED
jgi:hypothetical protein